MKSCDRSNAVGFGVIAAQFTEKLAIRVAIDQKHA